MRLLSTLALQGAMDRLAAAFAAAGGGAIEAEFAPTVALLERLRAGASADLAILTAEGIAALTEEGILTPGSRTDVALSFVGVAVRAGAAHPDLSTVESSRASLLAARSVAYSRIGASGQFFAGLIDRLGIAAAVNARARIIRSGFTAALAASGEVELAIQQVSELLAVPGIELVGKLPAAINTAAMFSAAELTTAAAPDQAGRFRQFLTSPESAAILLLSGLEPPTA